MISNHAFPVAGHSTRPVSITRPDSQETAQRTEAGQQTQDAAVSLNPPVVKAGPQLVSGSVTWCTSFPLFNAGTQTPFSSGHFSRSLRTRASPAGEAEYMWISLSTHPAGPATTALIFRWAEFFGAGGGFVIFVFARSVPGMLTHFYIEIFSTSF